MSKILKCRYNICQQLIVQAKRRLDHQSRNKVYIILIMFKDKVSSTGRQTLVNISHNLVGSWIKQLKFIIPSYDHSGKCLFHLHQTVIPKYIIIVMIKKVKITKHLRLITVNLTELTEANP